MDRSWLAMMVAVLMACSEPMGLAPGAVEFDPPPRYATLWADLEKCSGFTGDYSRVTFFRYDAATIPGTPGWVARATKSAYRVEFVASVLEFDGNVSHELLHLLIPESGHPAKYATMCPQVGGWP